MLGGKGTQVYYGDGPLTDGPPYHRLDGQPEPALPIVVARRRAAATTFAAVHEPYDKRARHCAAFGRLGDSQGIGIAVEADGFSDRVLVSFDPAQEHALRAADGEAFVFRDHGYLRVAEGRVVVRDGRGFPGQGRRTRARQGRDQWPGTRCRVRMGSSWSSATPRPQDGSAIRPTPRRTRPKRRRPPTATSCPRRSTSRAGGDRETTLHFRCVGSGKLTGKLRLAAPKGITVEPETVDIAGLAEGDEKASPRVRAAADAANGLARHSGREHRRGSLAPSVLPSPSAW